MSGELFADYDFVKTLIEKTSTQTGLKVIVRLNLKEYHKGINTLESEVDYKRIQWHPDIPELNYRIAA